MAAKFSNLLFFLLLLAFREMMVGEAAMCESRSRLFYGWCFSRSNCAAICEKEGFIFGTCKVLKCVCSKNCNGDGASGGQGPPAEFGGDGSKGGQSPSDGGDGGQGASNGNLKGL